MPINWGDVQQTLYPIKDYEDLCRRFQESFAYSFVRQAFNFSILELIDYTKRLLGGDARDRYSEYQARLVGVFSELHQAGLKDVLDLVSRAETRGQLEQFVQQSGIDAPEIVKALKYMVYWFIPGEKYLSGLVRPESTLRAAIQILGEMDIRTNLQLLQKGITPQGRKALAEASSLDEQIITELVNRADFSRLPWSSKATISNIIGAGYGSLAKLDTADPEKLYEDFFSYGKAIGKNLKIGNEIENSYRIARIVPVLVQEE
jgi:hypothetical protein